MSDRIHPQRLTGVPRARLLAVAAVMSGVLVTGCGGTSQTATVAGAATSRSSAARAGARTSTEPSPATGAGATNSSSPPSQAPTQQLALAFARCMRANGVPNFPDPNPGSGAMFPLPAGTSPAAPAFRAAQTKCQKLIPGGGPPVPGSTTHPSAHTLAKLLQIARCMRQHGVPQFPDPRTSVPSSPGGVQVITDFDGVILLIPSTINLQAPAYRQALTACDAPPLGLPH